MKYFYVHVTVADLEEAKNKHLLPTVVSMLRIFNDNFIFEHRMVKVSKKLEKELLNWIYSGQFEIGKYRVYYE